MTLAARIDALFDAGAAAATDEARAAARELLDALEAGAVRAAEPHERSWRAVPWVKRGILLAFRHGVVVDYPAAGPLAFRDKDLLGPRDAASLAHVRLVPGGSAVRRGAYLADGVVLMPPCYVNAGAWVGPRSMIDSHALVGSCAQVGAGVHLSAGVQIGGVLEPPGAVPVVIEDGAFIGALSTVVEAVRVGHEAVIGAGTVLTASTLVYDLPRRQVLRRGPDGVLAIPPRAVVVAGTRPVADPWGREQGLAAAAAIIVKDRDSGTDARAALEGALR